jgi:hypothetical protein
MKTRKLVVVAITSALTYFSVVPAQAGPYADDMAKCLVRSTTAADRTSFVRWFFAAAASHPAVQSLASVSAEQRDEANKSTAALFQKLLTESCRTEVQQAVKYEGRQTIGSSFQVFGEVAGRELFTDPSVTQAMGGFEKYFDKQKLNDLFNVNQ